MARDIITIDGIKYKKIVELQQPKNESGGHIKGSYCDSCIDYPDCAPSCRARYL